MWASDHQTCTSSIYGPSSSSSSNSFSEETSFLYSHRPSLPPSAAPPSSPPLRHHCVATVKGRNSYTSALVLAGEHLFTGSSDSQIRRNDPSSLHDHERLVDETAVVAGEGAVKALVASSSDKLISAHQDHKIRVWRVDHTVSNQQRITHLATLPTLSDRAIKLLLPKNHVQVRRHKKCTWIHHVDAVSALALSTDQSLLYSVSWDRTLKIWRTTDFKCLESVANAHDDAINAVAVSADGRVYTGSSDRKIKVWKQKPGEKTHSLDAILVKHTAGINTLAISTDGMVLYSGASDRLIRAWTTNAGGGRMEAAAALRGHTKSILCLATVADMVCSGSADKTVRIWRGIGKSYSCLAILEGHKGPIKCITVAFDHTSNPSNSLLYSSSLDCDIKVWKICLSR
ncbi:Transducin/WD40 repeat-like superfamily protein [Perilla frutescens var. hirtella]|uniref:Transducin/WD40 repeat-like superfamily protein n=1 Tax=Perilla frutescens var. hirtella TaxID=608512 RepID=A0AAD4IQP1_PERFH|nr:Transducin/WD40 repeat-like superfamily protein [Perilla frutescens var. hirtella]